jgi:dihydropteroate synthase
MNHSPKIMGILNMTPDSFYDGEKKLTEKKLLSKIQEIKKSDIIDIGCESSRPGANPISVVEEIKRFDKILPFLDHFDNIKLSIDTYKYEVAKYAVNHGITMINDITAGMHDIKMFDLAANHNLEIVLMHMQGNPKNMQSNPQYESIIDEILVFFDARIELALKTGIKRERIVIDPGIGFGKSLNNNLEIIKNIEIFKKLGFKVLLGHSRKAFLQYAGNAPKERFSASIGLSAYAAMKGVDILRVHDVDETLSMLNTINKLTI